MALNATTIRVRGLAAKADIKFARFLTKNGLIVFGRPATDRAWLSGQESRSDLGAVVIDSADHGPLAYLSYEPAGIRFPIIRVRACAASPSLSDVECGLAFGIALQSLERSGFPLIIDVNPQDVELQRLLNTSGWSALQTSVSCTPIRYLKGNADVPDEDDLAP